jgi:energy-coupling factor transporter ATP-binding protein EcfA2
MIRLESLTVHKLGNVAPNTELEFSSRGALLLGKNGTGKTTLLNIIVAVLRSDWEALSALAGEDGFDVGYSLAVSGPEESLHLDVRMKKHISDRPDQLKHPMASEPPADHELIVTAKSSSSTIRADSRHHETTLTFDENEHKIHMQSRSPADALLFGSSEKVPVDISESTFDQLFKLAHILRRHDEAQEYLRSITNPSAEPRALVTFYRHPTIPTGHSSVLSSSTCALLKAELSRSKEVPEHLRINVQASGGGDELPWLLSFCALSHFDKASLTLELLSTQQSSSATIVAYAPMLLRCVTHGNTLRLEQLSFGQRRLFSILHYLDANPSIVVADELVNGLHYDWIKQCIDLLEDRQAFLSSQNPILFDFMTFESSEDAASRFIECSTDEQGRFSWRNMSESDAHEFYATYLGGIQQVSSILYTRGYW